MVSRLIRFNRILSWILVLFAIVTIVSGYGITRPFSRPLIMEIHLWFQRFFIALLAFHVSVVVVFTRFQWMYSLRSIWHRKASSLLFLRVIQRLSGWIVLGTALLVIISGLDWYKLGVGGVLPFSQPLRYDVYLIMTLIIHVAVGAKIALRRKGIGGRLVNISILAITVYLLFLVAYLALCANIMWKFFRAEFIPYF